VANESWRRDRDIPVAIAWHGYVIRCEKCGAAGPWTLHVQQPAWTSGAVAWLTCPNGHEVYHPLIYPKIGLRLIDAPDVQAELDGLDHDPDSDWVPHIWRHMTKAMRGIPDLAFDYDDSSPTAWNEYIHGAAAPAYWREKWPDLWAADASCAGRHDR
jgi:hypothetical protein